MLHFCDFMNLRSSSDYFPVYPELAGYYNRDVFTAPYGLTL